MTSGEAVANPLCVLNSVRLSIFVPRLGVKKRERRFFGLQVSSLKKIQPGVGCQKHNGPTI
jgi:hypothetical protein